jgi:hypothetical protein
VKNRFMLTLLAIACCAFLCGVASAQRHEVDGLNFKLGDDVDTVKAALHTDMDPEPRDDGSTSSIRPNAGKTVINLRTKGIRVFFSRRGDVESILFDAPYAESIAGIKIGDPETKVRKLMGKPLKKPWNFGANEIFLYALDDAAYISFVMDDADDVQSIFINK